jgi:hypothetical protein
MVLWLSSFQTQSVSVWQSMNEITGFSPHQLSSRETVVYLHTVGEDVQSQRISSAVTSTDVQQVQSPEELPV